jgi:hypothetical protein
VKKGKDPGTTGRRSTLGMEISIFIEIEIELERGFFTTRTRLIDQGKQNNMAESDANQKQTK